MCFQVLSREVSYEGLRRNTLVAQAQTSTSSYWNKCALMFLCLCPQAIETCVAAAGFSVGEFAALVFSGAMNYAEGKHDLFLNL